MCPKYPHQVVCYYLTANWWAPYGIAKLLDKSLWDDEEEDGPRSEHKGVWWVYPLLSYLDADKDGTVSIQEFYDLKAVHILKMLFDGLDVNKDGLVKQREARLESFLRPTFLRTVIQELFDFVDVNNDNEISDGDYPVRCLERRERWSPPQPWEPGYERWSLAGKPSPPPPRSPFCLRRIQDLANKTEENCRLLGSPLQQVCKSLMTIYFSPEFDM